MNVEIWATDRPIPYARNTRKIPQEAIDKVAASIKEFGWRQPIVVDEEGVIIAGHTRLLAAHKLQMREVPIHIAVGLSKAQVKAYRIADNRVNQESSFDNDLLCLELEDLKLQDFDLSITGFNTEELDALDTLLHSTPEGLTDVDAVPEVPETPVTVQGDLWILGNHRLLCGDSTKSDTVSKLLCSVKPHLMVTDPPYGVEYDPDWRNRSERKDGSPYGAKAVGNVLNDERADWREAWALFPGNIAYVWYASLFSVPAANSLESCGFKIRSQIIWAKQRFVISRGDYHWQHEPCWYAVRGTGNWTGNRSQTTLWTIQHQISETGHGTQKPVEAMRRPMENNSSPGQVIYEPFSGSGTTIIAAETSGRICYAIELNPAYVDVSIKRWQDFTGKQAIHEDGTPFNDRARA